MTKQEQANKIILSVLSDGKEHTADEIVEAFYSANLNFEWDKKNISSWISKLKSKGFINSVDAGRYIITKDDGREGRLLVLEDDTVIMTALTRHYFTSKMVKITFSPDYREIQIVHDVEGAVKLGRRYEVKINGIAESLRSISCNGDHTVGVYDIKYSESDSCWYGGLYE